MDHTADSEVCLQGVDFDYEKICTPTALETHRNKIEAEKQKKIKEQEAALKLIEEEKQALALKFQPSYEASKRIWESLKTRVIQYAGRYFSAIAEHLKANFICAGSFPAFVVANELRAFVGSTNVPQLKYNDIDVYYGNIGDAD